MKISAIVDDKIIVKDGLVETVNDDSFWSTYSKVHAFQIDTDGESITENKDGTQIKTAQSVIDAIIKKYDDTKTATELAIKTAQDNFLNSWDRVREERNNLLVDSDKYIISDYPITDDDKNKIQTYRKSLRDIPVTYSSEEPKNITFKDGNVSLSDKVVITMPSV